MAHFQFTILILQSIRLHDFTYYNEMESSVDADQLTSSDLDLH